MNLTEEQTRVLKLALRSQAFQNLIGSEEWDLSEDEEDTLWAVIDKATE